MYLNAILCQRIEPNFFFEWLPFHGEKLPMKLWPCSSSNCITDNLKKAFGTSIKILVLVALWSIGYTLLLEFYDVFNGYSLKSLV